MMFDCFKKKEREPKTTPGQERDVDIARPSKNDIKAILFYAGHLPSRYGTRTYNRIEEHFSNALTVDLLVKEWKKTPIRRRQRKTESYKTYCAQVQKDIKEYAKDIKCELKEILVIELHYNAASVPEARGGYFMIKDGDDRSASIGKTLIDHFVDNTPMSYRKSYKGKEGIRGVDSERRGSGWIYASARYGSPTLLFEPFFCDYKTEETEWLFGEEELDSYERVDQCEKIAKKMSKLWIDALDKVI